MNLSSFKELLVWLLGNGKVITLKKNLGKHLF